MFPVRVDWVELEVVGILLLNAEVGGDFFELAKEKVVGRAKSVLDIGFYSLDDEVEKVNQQFRLVLGPFDVFFGCLPEKYQSKVSEVEGIGPLA